MSKGWIGVDLDGTLAHYEGWKGPSEIGEPIPKMMERVKGRLSEGIQVKIFTARASIPSQILPVREWLEKHGLGDLPITNKKDISMIELWDDRVIQVIPNTGEPVKKGTSKYEKGDM